MPLVVIWTQGGEFIVSKSDKAPKNSSREFTAMWLAPIDHRDNVMVDVTFAVP
jgi:hypothetical protein